MTAVPSVVLDTNVLVAAAFKRSGAAARIVAAIRRGEYRLVWHDATRRETEAVLRRIPPLDWNEFSSLFGPGGKFRGEIGPELFGQIEDPDDRKFAALAAATGATVITSDAHLLSCRDELPIAVLTAREFLSMTGDMPGMAAQAPPLESAATQVRGTIMSFIDSLVSHLGDSDIEADALPALVPAVIAAGVLIASADGAFGSRELAEIDDEALKCLMGDPSATEDIHRVVGLHMSNFDRDPEYGHDRALAVLADFAPDAPDDQKTTVLNAALHIARACHHGDLTPLESKAAREVAKILKLDLAAHGL